MEEKKSLIPVTVFMMDCGLATFKADSHDAAISRLCDMVARHGGKCLSREGSNLVFSFTGKFRYRFLTASVDASGEGVYTGAFREGNASTELRHYLLLFITLLLMGLCCWLMRSWWSLLPCLALIVLYFILNYAPEWSYIRRVQKMLEELEK